MIHGDTDEPQPSDLTRRLASAPRLLHGDGKHSLGLKGISKHLAIAGLENVEGQQSLREQSRAGQGHYRHFIRQFHQSNLSQGV